LALGCLCEIHEAEKVLENGRAGVRVDELEESNKILHLSRFECLLLLLLRELLLYMVILRDIVFFILFFMGDC
jgi:hypothetical protein